MPPQAERPGGEGAGHLQGRVRARPRKADPPGGRAGRLWTPGTSGLAGRGGLSTAPRWGGPWAAWGQRQEPPRPLSRALIDVDAGSSSGWRVH